MQAFDFVAKYYRSVISLWKWSVAWGASSSWRRSCFASVLAVLLLGLAVSVFEYKRNEWHQALELGIADFNRKDTDQKLENSIKSIAACLQARQAESPEAMRVCEVALYQYEDQFRGMVSPIALENIAKLQFYLMYTHLERVRETNRLVQEFRAHKSGSPWALSLQATWFFGWLLAAIFIPFCWFREANKIQVQQALPRRLRQRDVHRRA